MGNTKHRLPDIGDRHGRLVVCTEPQHIKSIWFINCKCDCGELVQVRHHHWVSGHTRSCGCMAAETAVQNLGNYALPKDPHRINEKFKYQHGLSTTRLYRIWGNMVARCTNPKNNSWEWYGGKGVSVCEPWRIFLGFAEWALDNGYEDTLTIERVNSNGNYEPDNCEWIPFTENVRRRKMPHKDTRPVVEGKRKCNVCELPVPVENFAKDSADKYGIRKTCKPCQRGVDALRALRTAKPPKYKSVAAALNLPPGPKRNSVMLTAFGETMCLSNWANDPRCVVNYATLNYRVKALWDHQEAITTKAQ